MDRDPTVPAEPEKPINPAKDFTQIFTTLAMDTWDADQGIQKNISKTDYMDHVGELADRIASNPSQNNPNSLEDLAYIILLAAQQQTIDTETLVELSSPTLNNLNPHFKPVLNTVLHATRIILDLKNQGSPPSQNLS